MHLVSLQLFPGPLAVNAPEGVLGLYTIKINYSAPYKPSSDELTLNFDLSVLNVMFSTI